MIPYIYNWETCFSLKNIQADGMSSNFFSAVVAAENLPDLAAAPMNVLAPAPMDVVLAAAPMDVICSDSDATQPPPKGRGRPSGSLNHATVEKNRQAAAIDKARSKKEAAAIKRVQVNVELEEERLAKEGSSSAHNFLLGTESVCPDGQSTRKT